MVQKKKKRKRLKPQSDRDLAWQNYTPHPLQGAFSFISFVLGDIWSTFA